MGITDDDRQAIVAYRIEKSFATFKEAQDVLTLGHLSLCANRLYYSAFHMASALLISHGHTTMTHAGVLRMINQHFIKEGLLERQASKLLNTLFSMRQQGDYGDVFDYEKDEIEPLIDKTYNLLIQFKSLISNEVL